MKLQLKQPFTDQSYCSRHTTELFNTSKSKAITMMSSLAPDATSAPIESAKLADLSDKIEKTECYARNESSQYPMTNLFIGDSRLGCKSDTDEQLIVHVAFNEFVKVGFFQFWIKSNSKTVENKCIGKIDRCVLFCARCFVQCCSFEAGSGGEIEILELNSSLERFPAPIEYLE